MKRVRLSFPERAMAIRSILVALTSLAALGACAPVPGPAAYGPPAVFSNADFAWSAGGGTGGIEGRVAFNRDGRTFECTGSVGLTPDTPYTRQRFQTLYGSTESAALPEAAVRARTVADPSADYRTYVRSTTCSGGSFRFDGLPEGGWFLITPVSAGGERIVLMRYIRTREGTTANITLEDVTTRAGPAPV